MSSANRSKLVLFEAATSAILCGLWLVGCGRPQTSKVSMSPPTSADREVSIIQPEQPPLAERTTEKPVPAEAAREKPPHAAPNETSKLAAPSPRLPEYVSIVERIDPSRPAQLAVNLEPPRELELTTDNVRRLWLTRDGLALSRNRSIVLRIDGQGIEWTPRFVAVELERSQAGAWTVVERRPSKP